MSNGKWILTSDLNDVKDHFGTKRPGSYMGVIYAIEYGDYLKIGCTNNPYTRMSSLISSSKNYGKMHVRRMLISPLHTNYRENEKVLHKKFKVNHFRAELFRLSLDQSKNEIQQIELLDERERLAKETSLKAEMFMGFVKRENPLMNIQQYTKFKEEFESLNQG